MKNELHVSKLITEMPMLKMSHNARLVLYSVLKKIWKNFRNREDYVSKNKLTQKDYEIARKPVVLNLSDLKPLFFKNATYKEIKEHIRKVPLDAEFKTYYDSYGVKKNYLIDTKIALFIKIQFDDNKKEITFTPNENLINYIEALKKFAKIDIEEMKKLKGNYQIRGYELICQNNYVDKSNKKLVSDEARKIKIEDLKRYFEVPETYTIARIDERVLNPLKKVINNRTKYNITNIKKYKLNPDNKCKVSHYRIDVEYKEEYLKELKEKYNDTPKVMTQEFFETVWCLYPLKKGKANIKRDDIRRLKELGYKTVKTCIERYLKYIEEKKKEGFNQSLQNGYKFFTTGYIDYLDENYKPYVAQYNNNSKPIQSTNFEQRKYDDEFFESLYDNFKV